MTTRNPFRTPSGAGIRTPSGARGFTQSEAWIIEGEDSFRLSQTAYIYVADVHGNHFDPGTETSADGSVIFHKEGVAKLLQYFLRPAAGGLEATDSLLLMKVISPLDFVEVLAEDTEALHPGWRYLAGEPEADGNFYYPWNDFGFKLGASVGVSGNLVTLTVQGTFGGNVSSAPGVGFRMPAKGLSVVVRGEAPDANDYLLATMLFDSVMDNVPSSISALITWIDYTLTLELL